MPLGQSSPKRPLFRPAPRRLATLVPLLGVLALAGCISTDFGRSAAPARAPAPVQPVATPPVQTASVQTTDLPPIGGTTAVPPLQPGLATAPGNTAGALPDAQASAGGFVSLDDVGAPGNTTGGRDLSGPLSMELLIGGWTVIAGAEQCRLNLTYTARGATGRYRASTPVCTQPVLSTVASWQLLGNQIQLYNQADELIGTLFRSGDRFVGTLSGGQGISMVG